MLPDEVSTSDAGVAPEGLLSASGDEWSMLGELKSVAVDAESLFGTSSVDGMSEEIVSRGSQNWCGVDTYCAACRKAKARGLA
jgi:hypothetical protein